MHNNLQKFITIKDPHIQKLLVFGRKHLFEIAINIKANPPKKLTASVHITNS